MPVPDSIGSTWLPTWMRFEGQATDAVPLSQRVASVPVQNAGEAPVPPAMIGPSGRLGLLGPTWVKLQPKILGCDPPVPVRGKLPGGVIAVRSMLTTQHA